MISGRRTISPRRVNLTGLVKISHPTGLFKPTARTEHADCKALVLRQDWPSDCYIACGYSLAKNERTRRAQMKKIMVIIMFLGLATTAFAQGRGNRGGGGERGNRGGARSYNGGGRQYNGGGYGGGYGGRQYNGGGYGARGPNMRHYGGEFRDGYGRDDDDDRGGYGYGGYGYRRYGYRPSFVFGYYGSPSYGPAYYRPYCDPVWGPCYPPPYSYGRPGISIGIGFGGVVIGREGRRFGRR